MNDQDEMKLPPGKTCGDCVHIKRCLAFGFTSAPTNTSCDFAPSRFVASRSSESGRREG